MTMVWHPQLKADFGIFNRHLGGVEDSKPISVQTYARAIMSRLNSKTKMSPFALRQYRPILSESERGHFRLTVQPRHDGTSVGLNRYRLAVFDAAEMSVEDAKIRLELWMPDHGHGSDRDPTIDWRDGSNYSVENVVYTMPGLWTWTLVIETDQYTDSINWAVDVR